MIFNAIWIDVCCFAELATDAPIGLQELHNQQQGRAASLCRLDWMINDHRENDGLLQRAQQLRKENNCGIYIDTQMKYTIISLWGTPGKNE